MCARPLLLFLSWPLQKPPTVPLPLGLFLRGREKQNQPLTDGWAWRVELGRPPALTPVPLVPLSVLPSHQTGGPVQPSCRGTLGRVRGGAPLPRPRLPSAPAWATQALRGQRRPGCSWWTWRAASVQVSGRWRVCWAGRSPHLGMPTASL